MKVRFSQVGFILAALILLGGMGCSGPKAGPAAGNTSSRVTLALVNGLLIDGTGADPVPEAVILLAGDKIAAVGTRASLEVPAGVQTIDLGGATILPGLINAHIHYGFDKSNLKAWAEGGVTTVRDESAMPASIAGLTSFRAGIAADPHYARLVSSGTMLAVPGGYGQLYVSSPEEAQKAVETEIAQGVDAIKVALEDGYAGQHGLPKLTPEELKVIVETAHAHGLPVSGHITQGAYLKPMLEAGIDDIAHMPYDYIPQDALQQMVKQDVYLEPTFTVFRNYGAPVGMVQNNLRQFVALGGKVALGNDYGGGPGNFELGIPMYEIQMMSGAGMTPMQIIVAATLNAAHVLRLDDKLGTLEAGKAADILVVNGNPLEDLQALTRIRMVIHSGAIIRDETGK
ncbi:MAG TPA: amidohydrolase family protein [Anaerolineales bacterium]|nr:amidohydrolase family protein [Anaerolineales bacterium]